MNEIITLSSDTVPAPYLVDSMPNVQVDYGVKFYTKSSADEKEIAEVFVKGIDSEKRVGWLIPILSMISSEHDYSKNRFFIKHVYEAMKSLNGKEFHENTYFLVYSKRILEKIGIGLDGELTGAFVIYGVYPFYKSHSVFDAKHKIKISKKLFVEKGFIFDVSDGFFKFVAERLLPLENNGYARFMFFYQVYELAMEKVFYKKINELKIARSHLGIIREKIKEYSSESKLITLLYTEMGTDKNDVSLAQVAKSIFNSLKEDDYYATTQKSAMLYDIRNTLVHSYYRYSIEENILYLASYIEDEAFFVLYYIYSVPGMRKELEEEYFSGVAE